MTTALMAKMPANPSIDKADVTCLNPFEVPDWDAVINTHADSTLFHGLAWATVLSRTYKHEPCYFGSIQNQHLKGLLPVMEVKSPFTGRRGVALPFSDECRALTSDCVESDDLFQTALAYGRLHGWRYLECRGESGLSTLAPPSLQFYGHHLDLSRGEKRLFEGCHGSIRRAIRKAQRSGVRVEIQHSMEAMRAFYTMHCQTRRRHGFPPQPFGFFETIHQCLIARGYGFMANAFSGSTPIASLIFVHLGKKAIYKFGASDAAFQSLRGNNLVMWAAIQWLVNHGFSQLHLGRTSLFNEGLRRFKLHWGAAEAPINYWKFDFARSAFAADTDKIEGWYSHVFRRMPMAVLRWLGLILYRHLS